MITSRTSGNAVLEEALMRVRKAIEEGRTIVDPLKESGVFPYVFRDVRCEKRRKFRGSMRAKGDTVHTAPVAALYMGVSENTFLTRFRVYGVSEGSNVLWARAQLDRLIAKQFALPQPANTTERDDSWEDVR